MHSHMLIQSSAAHMSAAVAAAISPTGSTMTTPIPQSSDTESLLSPKRVHIEAMPQQHMENSSNNMLLANGTLSQIDLVDPRDINIRTTTPSPITSKLPSPLESEHYSLNDTNLVQFTNTPSSSAQAMPRIIQVTPQGNSMKDVK